MNDRASSAKKSPHPKTPIKNPPRVGTSMTVQKYINAKLQYSQKKKHTIQKIIDSKDNRIKELEQQILDNQQLVKQTLTKWNQHKQKIDKQKQKQLHEVQRNVENLKQTLQHTERQINQKFNIVKKLQNQNQALKKKNKQMEEKYEKLMEKYKRDKKDWTSISDEFRMLLQMCQRFPPEIWNQYFY